MFDLSGRVIALTGAGGGIGRATAQALAKQGAALMLTDIDAAAAEEAGALANGMRPGGIESLCMRHDVTSSADWNAVFATVQSRWGRLDGMVNNAGIMVTVPFLELSLEQLRRQLEINVIGVFLGAQGAARLMVESVRAHGNKPSIVNLSSVYGQLAGPCHTAYGASKGAVRSLTKGMAVELGPLGIRANSVHPGPVKTAMLAGALNELASRGKLAPGDKGFSQVAKAHPMGRSAEPDDVAAVITFLCTDASAFMTGAELTVDGGYTLL